MSDLPPPPKKGARMPRPSMLDKNREVEAAVAADEALSLDVGPARPTTKLSIAPVFLDTMQFFDRFFLRLKHQRHSLKRYEVIQALLDEFTENPELQAAVVRRLKR